jgi:ABC-type lipoprotein export system ATPase subunit
MIKLADVHRTYSADKATRETAREVLRGVSLEIADGELVAIVGRSGSGKSTLLNVIGGLDTGYTGAVEVDGKPLRAMADAALSAYRNRTVGFVFQAFNLLDHLTCAENAALPALFRPELSAADVAARARAVLAQVGIADRADAHPTALSGGQKQRVAIARALFGAPRVMLCDEPTGNLDLATGAAILELFRELNRKEKLTLVIVTHEEAISRAADRVLRLDDGRLRADEKAA